MFRRKFNIYNNLYFSSCIIYIKYVLLYYMVYYLFKIEVKVLVIGVYVVNVLKIMVFDK